MEEFRPWAFGVARNMMLRHLRALKQDRHVFDEELVHQLADDAATLVERHAGHREALDHCLNKLPETQRQLVLTAYTKRTRIDDLAMRRSQTAMAIYKLLQRIRQALLECVRTLAEGAKEKLPAVMHIHSGGQRAFLSEVKLLVGRGYAALSVNWGGDGEPPFNTMDAD